MFLRVHDRFNWARGLLTVARSVNRLLLSLADFYGIETDLSSHLAWLFIQQPAIITPAEDICDDLLTTTLPTDDGPDGLVCRMIQSLRPANQPTLATTGFAWGAIVVARAIPRSSKSSQKTSANWNKRGSFTPVR